MRFMRPFQVEDMKSSARYSLPRWNKSMVDCCRGHRPGGRTVAADSQYLSFESDATGG